MASSRQRPLPLVAEALKLYFSAVLFRLSGSARFGSRLIDGLESPDENIRAISATLLSRAGVRAIPLLRKALEKQGDLPLILTILGDVGGIEEEPLLESYLQTEQEDVAKAARDALRVLRARSVSG